ncbi:MAG TPA: PQQ-binding-like beta-propeller repeat protein [Plasticicumulans sp.]|uniref:pyrroloquinoline quinone-dependent dehydrogenase n=1 Tax=Plasticicumulans sp. TaxID=2307179 RepID=UPI002CE395D4|nr:PQQ-binding-like beta-propeller repeat protein [Plasticicumulans sp.]HMV38598.1 PQQ-binding-like beta-propeller repeat protein [Plasticicumulans sp.]HMW29678.1 PQQ-binding-like beta-propeller repeat protein [Plasticicumulans sp.]HNE00653.1 PQQ-binding-like beta-propeller repeat protein [Plasticicumulans sp.]HNG49789.1 PQQ-binding-like beta-propeller repeat protein [Plasticicumulans sp.]HNI22373.1 PQQ-binding-like beta-propeller repeat protein [Plasticicumulans sp.]
MHRILVLLSAFGLAAPALAGAVDDARLRDAAQESGNWLSYGRDYGQQRFSPLTQINRETIGRLVPKWIYQTGTTASFQATPIVVDGVLYLSMPFDHVAAIDAASGRELWRYEHQRRTPKMCCGPASRGVAVAYGKVFIGTVDARLIALDAASGKPVWDVAVATDEGPTESVGQLDAGKAATRPSATGSTGIGVNMAPLVVDGKVIVGITGVGYGLHLEAETPNAPVGTVVGFAGRYGRPGFYAAFDAQTGRRVWQFDTVPASGWEGSFRSTTPDGVALPRDPAREQAELGKYPDAARYGGGSAWTTPAYDAVSGLLYVGIGNPSPQMDDRSRPGDNLYTVSLAALDAGTGTLKWHFQQVPHDLWGYDVASPPLLFELPTDKGPVAAVGQASKLGWFYAHERRSGALLFKSEAFVPQENLFAAPTAEGTRIAPGAVGGASWSPVAFDPASGLAYVAAAHIPIRYTLREIAGTKGGEALRYTELKPVDEPNWGTLTAIATREGGRIRWQQRTDKPLIGGVLATAGGLVFTGEGDGFFDAFDAATGERLWRFQCGAGVNAPPVTYEVDGVQYVAVAAGGNSLFGYKSGGALIVFALQRD